MTAAPITRTIHSTGEQLAVVGLGTWQTFDVGPNEYGDRAALLEEFLARGGQVVDSSPMYGRAEAAVGAALDARGLGSGAFLATKVWTTGREAGRRQIEDSFRHLRTDRLDLLQVHNLVDLRTQLATLRELKGEGRVRYIGVTHYTSSGHDAIARVIETEAMDFVQINYSVSEREAENRVLPSAMDRGVAVIINRPFAEGALMQRLRSRPVPAWAAEIDCRTWAQLLLKFVIAHPAVTTVIPATANPQHLRDNIAAMYGSLPDAALRTRIIAAAR